MNKINRTFVKSLFYVLFLLLGNSHNNANARFSGIKLSDTTDLKNGIKVAECGFNEIRAKFNFNDIGQSLYSD